MVGQFREVVMKLSEYLVFAALLIPTLIVVLAAVISLVSPDPAPEYRPPLQVLTSTSQ